MGRNTLISKDDSISDEPNKPSYNIKFSDITLRIARKTWIELIIKGESLREVNPLKKKGLAIIFIKIQAIISNVNRH